MNNLLRTLTESQVKPAGDLRLLLTAVNEARRQNQDSKLSDPFFDSLEGLLADLKSVTIDNHDAEAFLKPVSRVDVPDYYDVISNPMDFQTMLKKVKQKAYKSKRDFRDDLELIWSNCYKYNAAEDHPLRGCVDRLRIKAEKLLRYITDRKERTDPPIPNHQYNHHHQAGRAIPKVNGVKPLAKDAPFLETPALVRTPEGMASFLVLDKGLSVGDEKVLEQLRGFTDPASPMGSSPRPSKRARLEEGEDEDTSQLWWNAVPGLVANGVPGISPSSSSPPKQRTVSVQTNPKSLLSVMNANIKTMKKVRGTHAKFAALATTTTTTAGGEEAVLDGEAGVGVGTGITTGFGGFTAGLAVEEDVLGEGDTIDERPWLARMEGKGKVVGRGKKKAKTKRKEEVSEGGIEIGEVNAHECIKWMNEKVLEHVGFQGTSASALAVLAGLTSEYLLNVGRTIRYLVDQYAEIMTPEEIILHTLFESGSSKVQDLERYISDDVERYGARLSELEKKLVGAYRELTANETLEDEGLFDEEDEEETGALAMGDFADMLGEDYLGLRELGIAAEFGMSSLSIPKRLLKGKKGKGVVAAAKPTEPPPPYPPPPPFVLLTSSKVDDQIGLLRSYYQSRFDKLAADAVGPAPPPPFIAPRLSGPMMPGLAGPSLPALAGPSMPVPAPALVGQSLPGPTALPGLSMPSLPPLPTMTNDHQVDVKPPLVTQSQSQGQSSQATLPSHTDTLSQATVPPQSTAPSSQDIVMAAPARPAIELVLPNDAPNALQMKMGPLGQIVKVSGGAGGSKKRVRGPQVAAAASGSATVDGGEGGGAKKVVKKGNVGVGTGNGRKKNLKPGEQGQPQSQPPISAGVVASA